MAVKDEQEWFNTFYEGTFLVKGWKHRMRELLHAMPDTEKENVTHLLEGLGRKIGREWARDNRLRKIDTPALQKWGEELRLARKKGASALVQKIKSLDGEVDRIIGSA